MRYVPLPFPCGCVVRSGVPEYGAGLIVTIMCKGHRAAHEDENAVTIDESSIAGCDCPTCDWGRYCVERGPCENATADNWNFLARLKMRRVSEIVGRPAQRRKR